MNTRAALLALALSAGCSWTDTQAQDVPPPFGASGAGAQPRNPLGALRNGTYARNRRLPNDRYLRGDSGVDGPNLRPGSFYQDSDASNLQAAQDNAGGVTPVENWLPPTSGGRDSTRHVAVRALRNAFRDALARSTEVDETILSLSPFQNENRRSPESSSSGSWEDRVRFRVGVSDLTPKVEMLCDMGGGALGLSVGALGQVHFELAPSRTGSGMFQAGLNPVDGRYDVGYRLTF